MQGALAEAGTREGVEYEQNAMIHIHEDAIMKFIILYSAFKI